MTHYKYRVVVKTVAVISIVIGLSVLAGWIFDSKIIVTLLRGYAPMKVNTAICLVSCGIALIAFFSEKKYSTTAHALFAILVTFLGGFSFFGNIFHFNLINIDKIFINDISAEYTNKHFSGRMSVVTSLCFMLIGLACLNLRSNNQRLKIVLQWSLHIVTMIALVATLAHVYEVPDSNEILFLSPMAMHTAIVFFVLSVSIALINPDLGVTGLLTGDKIGNIMAKWLFPTTALLLFGITYLRLEVYRHSSFGMEFVNVLFTAFILLVNLVLIWVTATQLNKLDAKRKTAEDSIDVLNKNFERNVENRTMTLKEALYQLEVSRQELSEALNKEKELSEIKSRFVSLASHEFKTPLSTILSSASLISCYVDADEQGSRDKHVSRITNSVIHLNRLLEDFLSLGKLEAGRVNIEMAACGMNEFLEDLMEEMGLILKAGQVIQLKQNGPDEFITDKGLLKNIMLNILSNAIKFSPENSKIQMLVSNHEDNLLLSVEDHGIGISPEDQQHLFSSFFRGKNASNIQGTGLGLHIVRKYVDMLQGKITLRSELGKGTIINIELPKVKEGILV